MLRFSYDINGQRQAKIERSYGNVVHTTKYFYDGTKLAGEKKDDTIVWYDYDENGAPVGMRVNGLDYIFRKNLQGDITGIYNSSDELIVEYTYSDAWGAGVTVSGSAASTIGMYNSFRYRGYYYDTESGLYYLNSRYYDPVACRFINADGYVSTGQGNTGHNMYSYCGNNPVNRIDVDGRFWQGIKDWFRNAWNSVKTWAKNTFGFCNETVNYGEIKEKVYLPSPLPVTAQSKTTSSQVVSRKGDFSKPVTVYLRKRSDNINLSSVGVKFKAKKLSLNLSLGLDDIGLSGTIHNGSTDNTLALKTNLSKFETGIEVSETIHWDEYSSNSTATNVSVNKLSAASIVVFVLTGQPVWQSAYS